MQFTIRASPAGAAVRGASSAGARTSDTDRRASRRAPRGASGPRRAGSIRTRRTACARGASSGRTSRASAAAPSPLSRTTRTAPRPIARRDRGRLGHSTSTSVAGGDPLGHSRRRRLPELEVGHSGRIPSDCPSRSRGAASRLISLRVADPLRPVLEPAIHPLYQLAVDHRSSFSCSSGAGRRRRRSMGSLCGSSSGRVSNDRRSESGATRFAP